MRVSMFAPGDRLAPYISRLIILEADEATTRTLIPDSGLNLYFRFRGFSRLADDPSGATIPDAAITGLRDTPRRILTSAGGGAVIVTLREGQAPAFFPQPLHELYGTTVGLDALLPARDLSRLGSDLALASGDASRLAAVEEFLFARRRADGIDRVVAAAVRAIRAAHGSIRIAELASDLGLSPDRLEKRFRRAVGSSPKQLASLLRLRRALDLHKAGADLSRVTTEAGYFDQSHFIRDFRRFTGAAPTQVLGAGSFC